MSETGKMIQMAADGGAADALGMVLDVQARDRDWATTTLIAGLERRIEELEEELRFEQEARHQIYRRMMWLFDGADLGEDF